MSSRVPKTSYDLISYPSYAYSQTHPDHLATLAILSGLSPPPVDRCRVLELGCGKGGNIIPIAYGLPGSEFVGVDLSGDSIAEGKSAIRELGLANVDLHHMDIMDVGEGMGRFDYIIVHGIYSWVPSEVQHKILDVCKQQLSPDGVAFVSYNAYPGWHMYNIVRDVMIYHNRRSTEPEARIKRAREFLEFLSEANPAEDTPYGFLLNILHDLLGRMDDGYVQHDFMEDLNQPQYFYQFVEQARAHGLQYLANAEFNSPLDLPDGILETIDSLSEDPVELEQYLDFMTNRTFRQTLLCHESLEVKRSLGPESVSRLLVASNVQPVNEGLDVLSSEEDEFVDAAGTRLATAHPLTKAALVYLANAWPKPVAFDALTAEARRTLEEASSESRSEADWASESAWEEAKKIFARNVLIANSQSSDLIAFHTHAPGLVSEVSDSPRASLTARYQAKADLPITNLFHFAIKMNEAPRHLMAYLDGNHDRAALMKVMEDFLARGLIEVTLDDAPVLDVELARPYLEQALDDQLAQMASAALLVG